MSKGGALTIVTRALAVSFCAVAVACTGFAVAQGQAEFPLGKVDFPVSCAKRVQEEFDRAVALLHHMTYPEAKSAFERVAELDPDCAMAHWGVAMTLFHPLWPDRPGPSALQEGWVSAQRAEALGTKTERERLFVAAADSFFREPRDSDYWARIRRWEHAQETLYREFPNDPEAAAFYALAHLATAPADGYSLDHQDRSAEILLTILEGNPIHPGATHYLIHANDVRGRERESLDIVRGYQEIAPRNPHALHMPTHIATRLGNWDEVIDGNLRAAEAALEHPAGDDAQYVWDEFPHAIEYLVYAYLQEGADWEAASQIDRLLSTESLQPSFKTAFHVSSVPARYALERGAWEEASELVPRPYAGGIDWDRFPWPEAVTWFGRGLGAARLGRLDAAEQALDHLQVLENEAGESGEALFARQIQILRLGVSAWIAQALDQQVQAIEQMEAAAELEVATPKHPVTPAPTLPSQELLGELLQLQGQSEKALVAFKESLELYPQRFNSLLGAARASDALGDRGLAAKYYSELLAISSPDATRPGVEEARTYLDNDY